MKTPGKGTAKHAICMAIHQSDSLLLSEILSAIASKGFSRKTIDFAIDQALDDKSIYLIGARYLNNTVISRYFKKNYPDDNFKRAGQVATPRTAPPIRPLRASLIPSALGTREGSNDFREIKSKFNE